MADRKHKACGHLGIFRVSHETVEGDFRCENYRVRGPLSIRVLAALFNAVNRGQMAESSILPFLEGGSAESNLAPGVARAVVDAVKAGRVTPSSLVAFLEGGGTDSNLAPGAQPIDLGTFLRDRYLPKKKPDVKPRTYQSANDEVKRLTKTLGMVPVHEIRSHHAEQHKSARLALKMANVSTKQDLITLSEALTYAVACGLVKANPLPPVRGLPATDRTSIWLRLKDIARLMLCLPRDIKALAYFLVLTGARINEALAMTVAEVDWVKREIRIPNSKRRRRSASKGKRMRTLKIDDLGPRLEWLLKKMIKPDPVSGHLFLGRFPGRPMSVSGAEHSFHKGVVKAGLEHLISPEVIESGGHPHVIPHDCRRGFANHGSIAGWSFQKLRDYMGQINAASVQAYLDEADGHDLADSIFCHHPLRARRAQARQRLAPPVEAVLPEHRRPADLPPRSAYLLH